MRPQLDQRALEAVEAYRFKPAMADKKPVPITMAIEVSFNLY
jgi:outer membrane biosynthesis protein TonB